MRILKKKATITSESSNGSGTELSEIIETIQNQKFCNTKEVLEFFWDMFIVDTYLGNFDRHNGNWGFLVNEEKNSKRIAPIYDCGSCLYPQATDENLKEFLSNREKIEVNKIKINMYDFLKTTNDENCIKSLNKVTKKILEKENEINRLIDTLPVSEIRKNFYKLMLKERKEKILLDCIK